MAFTSAACGVALCYKYALSMQTFDEAINVIINGDPMNWAIHGQAILVNIAYAYNHRAPILHTTSWGVGRQHYSEADFKSD